MNDGTANPTLGCSPLIDFPAGAIALIDRGVCAFVDKVRNAQAAGASAVIVANNLPGDPFTMGGDAPDVVIPSVMVSLPDGTVIKVGLPATGTVARADLQPVQGTAVTIALDGEQTFRQAKASAMLLPGQNRFTALRQLELYACTAGNPANPTCDGSTDNGWTRFLRSHRDTFPGPNPRPTASDLILRSFQIPPTTATHVKFVVATTSAPGTRTSRVTSTTVRQLRRRTAVPQPVGANEVRAAELQLLTSRPGRETLMIGSRSGLGGGRFIRRDVPPDAPSSRGRDPPVWASPARE